ncbi:hypothetical protein [Candidatus Oleimmundimicrobium sp.]|uniref:hypothetical protein n=1 Tax=Candidatus Oleimmundimicrobium sp. TaxID=3060597 RepID=UPI002725CDB4|nr:hypothetical protein [Candidatus Oleimmundimicrobium sp.]MDO8886189.1 hypothetical protein [Candidatus Oleimmundimicrobium sp.]
MITNEITKEDAFLHLIYEYRCLSTVGYAWRRFGDPKSNDSGKAEANKIIPEISTVIQDSLLLHTRTLIEFYWPNQSRSTDINISLFTSPKTLDKSNYADLIRLKRPIEVHVLHLTIWRDTSCRSQSDNDDTQRPDWNKVNGKIFDDLIRALEELSNNLPDLWNKAFKRLKEASESRFKQGANFNWPDELGEKGKVKEYLQNLSK